MIVRVHIFSLTGKSMKCVGTKGSLAPYEGLLFILTPTRSMLRVDIGFRYSKLCDTFIIIELSWPLALCAKWPLPL